MLHDLLKSSFKRSLFDLPELKIGDFTARLPIIQGGMSVGISLSNLASAVANEGGIGVIGAAGIGMLEPDFNTNYRGANQRALRKEIRKARSMTNGLIGVNILAALTDFYELVKVAVKEQIDFIFVGAGLPLKNLATIVGESSGKIKTKLIPIVSSGRTTRIIFQYWAKHYKEVPDAVVVEGPKAGGHLGFKKEQIYDPNYKLENILPSVVESVKPFENLFKKKIPVIAAGGIYTGHDIFKFMKLGASGVQMATRFVATKECDASPKFKEMYIKSKKEDIVIIDSPVGMPGRAIKNEFLKEVEMGDKKPFTCRFKCLKTCDFRSTPYCIALALTNAKLGKMLSGFAFAGENAYRVKKITTVKKLIRTLKREYKKAAKYSAKKKNSRVLHPNISF